MYSLDTTRDTFIWSSDQWLWGINDNLETTLTDFLRFNSELFQQTKWHNERFARTHKKEQNNEMRTENNYRCNYKINFDKLYKVIVSYRWFLTAE